jgi:hypothetical protein
MKSQNIKRLLVALTSFAIFSFASWVFVSASQLNATTIQSIDGPLNGTQVAALQLSTILTATALAFFMGSLFIAMALMLTRRVCGHASSNCH